MQTVLEWMNKSAKQAFNKGCTDKEYNPPCSRSPMSSHDKKCYVHGWRSQGNAIPPGRDRHWFRVQLKCENYCRINNTNCIPGTDYDAPEYEPADYDENIG